MTSNKQGRQSVIVDRIGYDKEGHMVYTKLGNGTEATYIYDKQRERLQAMNLTADGQTVMENRYQYDAVDNILGITNAANPTSLTKLNKSKLGGGSMHTYGYEAYLLYRDLLADEDSLSKNLLYKFNSKELVQETRLCYYRTRYMNPVISLWYGVKPM